MGSDFSIWIRGLRGQRTKSAVERGAGVHRASIMRAENGDALLSARSLRRLCAYYGADFNYGIVLMNAARTQRERGTGTQRRAA